MNKKRIAYIAAHSGGHILPALTHAHQKLKDKEYTQALFFSSSKPLDVRLIRKYKQQEIKPILLPLTGHPKEVLHYFFFPIQILGSFFITLYWLLRRRPEKIISMGGILSIPVCFAGYILGIPFELYELNVEPGKAINLLSRWAQEVHICFDQTVQFLPNITTSKADYPLRYQAYAFADKKTILDAFRFSPSRTTLLIIGGSQGSIFINQLIKNWLTLSDSQQFQIIHQTGSHDPFDYKQWYETQKIPALVFEYADDLAPYYQVADYAIGRAGAGSIAEMEFFTVKSLLIPLVTEATSHQIANAQAAYSQSPNLFPWASQKSAEKLYSYITARIEPTKVVLLD